MKLVGKVESLWRYPVKSMRGEELHEAFLGFSGMYGDRIYAFQSSAAPKGFPYFTGREQQALLLYRPSFRHPERAIRPTNLADAEALGSGVTPVYASLSDLIVDVETPAGERLAIDDPRLIDSLRDGIRDAHEVTLMRSERALTDCRPVSILSVQTTQQLGEELGFPLDKRRFRTNVYVELESGDPYGENNFVGRTLRIGPRAVVAVLQRDNRCKMITLDPDTAQSNPDVMKHVASEHDGKVGVYGAVLVEGSLRPGDGITLLD